MSNSVFNAVESPPLDSTSIARIKRTYQPETGRRNAHASNDPAYPLHPHDLPLSAWSRLAELANGFGDAAIGVRESGADSFQLAIAARSFRSAALGAILFELASAAVDSIYRAIVAWRRWRDRRATEQALRSLDAHTLRDIGFDPSEVRSVAEELHEGAEPSRTHALMRLRYLQI
jgi:uncharacterized protein YjiS (DUF1127 family)